MMDDQYPADEPFPTDEEPPYDPWAGLGSASSTSDAPPAGASAEDESDPVMVLMEMFTQHTETQAKMQEILDGIIDDMRAVPDGPWAWAELRGPAREKLWRRLFDWVAWLEDRYLRHISPQRTGIPIFIADWYRHPVAVELFTALMVAHVAAYRRKAAAPSFTLVDWHERALFPTLARIEHLGLFSEDYRKKEWDEGSQPSPTRRDQERFATWMTEDVNAHPPLEDDEQ